MLLAVGGLVVFAKFNFSVCSGCGLFGVRVAGVCIAELIVLGLRGYLFVGLVICVVWLCGFVWLCGLFCCLVWVSVLCVLDFWVGNCVPVGFC